jgi:protein TonB
MRLIESNATRPRRRGGMLVSAVAHAALIALAVVATGSATDLGETEQVDERIVWSPPPAPAPTSPSRPAESRPRGPTAPGTPVPALPAPTFDLTRVPTVIPEPGDVIHVDPARGLFGGARPLAGGGDAEGRGAAVDAGPLPSHVVDRQVVLVGDPPRPRYPEALRTAGVDGRVVVRFVVDTAGRVEEFLLTPR